ncbi:MAG: DUF1570 domain-containing protein [Phycisphaerae bacterium]
MHRILRSQPGRLPWALVVPAVIVLGGGCAQLKPGHVGAITEPWSYNGFTGRRITTEHFEVISTLRDAEFEAALPGFVEAAYKRYESTVPSSAQPDRRLTIYVLATRPEWLRFTRCRFPARLPVYSKIRAGGYTEGNTSVLFHANRWSTLATIAHEGWHQYVALHVRAAMPAWLNEGLACWHEAVDWSGPLPRFTPQHNTYRLNSLRSALRENRVLPLAELLDTDPGAIIGRDDNRLTQEYYAQVWALITFLRTGSRHAGAFDALLRDIGEGRYSARVGAARLVSADAAHISPARAVFQTYFGPILDAGADQYYDHLVRLAMY